jgi:hypothetical protein
MGHGFGSCSNASAAELCCTSRPLFHDWKFVGAWTMNEWMQMHDFLVMWYQLHAHGHVYLVIMHAKRIIMHIDRRAPTKPAYRNMGILSIAAGNK